jgi:hypothetical protein
VGEWAGALRLGLMGRLLGCLCRELTILDLDKEILIKLIIKNSKHK